MKFIYKARIIYTVGIGTIKVVETASNNIDELKDLIDRADKHVGCKFTHKATEIYKNGELTTKVKGVA